MTISAGVFKATCLKLMEEVRRTNKEFIITKHGKPIAKLVPFTKDNWKPGSKTASGWMKGCEAVTLGDIVGPLGVKWEAAEDE
jgi:prevent-host-death family protein